MGAIADELILVLLVTACVIAWRRRPRPVQPRVSQPQPTLIIRGHDTTTIEKGLLNPSQTSEALSIRRLDSFAMDDSLLAYFGKDWLNNAKDAVCRLSQWQLDTSWELRQEMIRKALTYAGQIIPFADGELPQAIARDVGVASVLHAMACHNLMVWLRSRGNKSAHDAFLGVLATTSQSPATPADMLAARRLTEPLSLLLQQASWLEDYLSSAPNWPEKQRAAAKADLREQLHRVLFILYLHECKAGNRDSILTSILRTNTQMAVADLWRAYTHVERVKVSSHRTPAGAIDYSYRWYVKVGHDHREKPLRTVIEELCPRQFAALHHSKTRASTFEAAVAELIVRNPIDLINRMPVFPWRRYQMNPQALPGHLKLSWEELTPLLRRPYWIVHDKLAASLAHSLCRLVNGEGDDFEKRYLRLFVEQAAEPPWSDSTEEVYWGARHLLLCCHEHLVQRNDRDLGLNQEAQNSDVRLLGFMLLSFHFLRLEFDRRANIDKVTAYYERRFRERYARFRCGAAHARGPGDETKMIRLCVAWGGAFYPGRPQTVVTWPPPSTASNGTHRERAQSAGTGRRLLILESDIWGNPHEHFRELVNAQEGWHKDERESNVYVLALDKGLRVKLNLKEMTFEVPPQLSQDSELTARVENEFWELAFRAYAKGLEQAYGLHLHVQPAQARIVGEGMVDNALIRVEFNWHNRVWWLDEQLLTRHSNWDQ